MKLVAMAEIRLNRPGSLRLGGGFQGTNSSQAFTVVVDGEQPGYVLEKVRELAKAHGEDEEGIKRLTVATPFDAPEGQIVFSESPEIGRTQYGLPYAECRMFPALEIDGRYFGLTEVTLSRS